jgi:tetraacyldisaccharide 4'-kinase
VAGEETGARELVAAARARDLPVLHGRLVPDPSVGATLKGRKVLAFAGIGDPTKFFLSADEAGITVAETRAFPDHHRFSAEEAARLMMEAEHNGLALLTTEKDRARMAGDTLTETLAARVHVLPVTMVIDEIDELRRLVMEKVRH